ncbi:STAS domain-containing protein, partial [Streptomyces lydicus]
MLELRGDLDILAVSVLSDRLDELTGAQGVDLVIDVRAVTFIDCAGLSLLSRARHRTPPPRGPRGPPHPPPADKEKTRQKKKKTQ